MIQRRVLISTIDSKGGGVSAMSQFVTEALKQGGYEFELAHYEPFSQTPNLSVPLYKLGKARPGREVRPGSGNSGRTAIGAWLPELEFTHFWPTREWKSLMEKASHFISVSGNAMAGLPFAKTNRPFLAWIATDLKGDREERVAGFPLHRRSLDMAINYPCLRYFEKQILKNGNILALSDYTRVKLSSIVDQAIHVQTLPMPIDHQFFTPAPDQVVKGRIGFSARLHDPRKNLRLLLDAVSEANKQGCDIEVLLIGGEPPLSILQTIERMYLDENVNVIPFVPKSELRDLLQSLDVYVIPSHQEGLCIAALEAMACGCPVVSTRCGGPEEFVRDDETGYLVDFDAAEMADAITRIISDHSLRSRLSQGARQLVVKHYNRERCESIFWKAFEHQKPPGSQLI